MLFALGGAVFSVLIILVVAAKWNILERSTVLAAVACAAATATPLARLYASPRSAPAVLVALLFQVGLTLGLALSLSMLRFWRDPERSPAENEGVVLSAADGRVIYAKAVGSGSVPLISKGARFFTLDELAGGDALRGEVWAVGVEMNLLDVHVNRCPIAGRVRLLKHIEGRFMSLRREEAPFVNERVTTVVEGRTLSVTIVQVASRLVRRITSYVTEGEWLSPGQRLGMIRFGSLVVVLLPKRDDVTLEAKVGDRVEAGTSVLARYVVSGRTPT